MIEEGEILPLKNVDPLEEVDMVRNVNPLIMSIVGNEQLSPLDTQNQGTNQLEDDSGKTIDQGKKKKYDKDQSLKLKETRVKEM